MKTAARETQTRYATLRSRPSTWGGRLEQTLLNHAGWKVRKSGRRRGVFLDFPFYRTNQDLAALLEDKFRVADQD
jgi:hypothetical protein